MKPTLPLAEALTTKYPFAALPEPDGSGWAIVFPDIPGVIGFSPDLAGIGPEVASILAEWMTGQAEDGRTIPAPSPDWDPIQRKPEDFTWSLASADDVAQELGLSKSRVIALAHARGVGRMVGNAFVFRPEEIDALRERHPGRPRKATAAATG